jgi:single-strand DNA-binding protein
VASAVRPVSPATAGLSREIPAAPSKAEEEMDMMMNLVVVDGVLTKPAQDRELPSGSRLLTLDVTVRPAEGPAESLPVAWFDAPAWASSLDQGTPIVVVGRVRRRFFKAGGVTQSRTEVVADRVVRATDTRRVRALMVAAGAAVEAAATALGA